MALPTAVPLDDATLGEFVALLVELLAAGATLGAVVVAVDGLAVGTAVAFAVTLVFKAVGARVGTSMRIEGPSVGDFEGEVLGLLDRVGSRVATEMGPIETVGTTDPDS